MERNFTDIMKLEDKIATLKRKKDIKKIKGILMHENTWKNVISNMDKHFYNNSEKPYYYKGFPVFLTKEINQGEFLFTF